MIELDRTEARKAAEILRAGGVIVYPAETVYGLGCDPWNLGAWERIVRLKQRDSTRSMLLLADSREMVEEVAGKLGALAARLAEAFWPGSLTLVLRPEFTLPGWLYGPTGGVAFRVTTSPVSRAIIGEFGKPVVSTSANISGEPTVATFEEARRRFGDSVDLVMGSPVPLSGVPSTVVDVASGRVELLREGAVPPALIREVMGI